MEVKIHRKDMISNPTTTGEILIVHSGETLHSYVSRKGIALNRVYKCSYDHNFGYITYFQSDPLRILINSFFDFIRNLCKTLKS